MRFLTRKGVNILGRNFMIIPWIGLMVGLCLCSLVVVSDGLLIPLQQLHLSIYGVPTTGKVYGMNAEANDKYYVNCRFNIKKPDGSTEFVSKTRAMPEEIYNSLQVGDEVRIVYSSKRPDIWLLGRHQDDLLGKITISCFGLILLIAGGGSVLLMRPKK